MLDRLKEAKWTQSRSLPLRRLQPESSLWRTVVLPTPNETHEAEMGPIDLSVKEKEAVNIPVWGGVGAIVLSGGLQFPGSKKRWPAQRLATIASGAAAPG
jgi:hypothetical protein